MELAPFAGGQIRPETEDQRQGCVIRNGGTGVAGGGVGVGFSGVVVVPGVFMRQWLELQKTWCRDMEQTFIGGTSGCPHN